MCTVSFLPEKRGFFLAMNRDEQKTRARAVPPKRHKADGQGALYPSEKGGGTWVGVNDAGLTFALINWYAKPQRERSLCLSRGVVIPHLVAAGGMNEVAGQMRGLALARFNPFRLIAISVSERKIREWRWDGKSLTSRSFAWKRRHWFSSGFDERLVSLRRKPLVRAVAETPEAIRELHRAHAPERGPFSICMHRDVSETVSLTEISVTKKEARLRYAAGAPCRTKLGATRAIAFTRG